MTTTLLTLDERLCKATGDWIQVAVTTAMTASVSLVSTNLASWTGRDDYFNDWYVYIVDGANSTEVRKISDYDSTAAAETLTIRGANLTAETTKSNIRVSRSSWDDRLDAINDAIRETYPNLHTKIEDTSLITGNILPPFMFSSSTALRFYSATNATIAQTTGAGGYMHGVEAAKITPSAANGYLSLHSDNYPRLLDMRDLDVDIKGWALPETADDPTLTIATKTAAGSTQTLASTTACPAGEFTLIELEGQDLNDDLVELDIKMIVATSTKYTIFETPRLMGRTTYEYLLPEDFQNGDLYEVYIQTSGNSDDVCDDVRAATWERVFGYEVIEAPVGSTYYKFLRLPYAYSTKRRLKLVGTTPLTIQADAADTVEIDGETVNLLIAYAKYKLYQKQEGIPASEDISRYERASAKAYGEYMRLLPRLKMPTPAMTMNIKGV